MKLLLDEHFSHRVAEQLRKRGCDVIAVVEQVELREMCDDDLVRWANEKSRAIVTENVQDFLPIHGHLLTEGEAHAGLVLTSPRTFPRSGAGIGPLVTALTKLLTEHPDDDWLRSDVFWL